MTATIASTILSQLGGSKFIAMTGAHSLLNLENGLQAKFRGSKVANTVRIVLEPTDTYTVTFYKITKGGLDVTEVEGIELVHAGDLRRLFTRITKLEVSL